MIGGLLSQGRLGCSRKRWTTSALSIVLVAAVGSVATARERQATTSSLAPRDDAKGPGSAYVPLSASFSRFEIAASVTAALAGGFLMRWGPEVFGAPEPGMGPPSPGSLDARITRGLGNPGGGRFLLGIPDKGGIYVLPMLPLAFYGFETVSSLRTGHAWLVPGEKNPHHRLAAYVEALGFTLLVTGSVKSVVGRPRPYTKAAFDRAELRTAAREDNVSFFSGHSSLTFAAGAFVTADVSRALLQGPLAGASDTRRFLLGQMLPTVVGYGIPSVVGVSRVIDQQHWPSDVTVGALVGGLVGHLAYVRHLDGEGRPIVRIAQSVRPAVITQPDGVASIGWGFGGHF